VDIIRTAYLSTLLTWLKEFLLFYMCHIWALQVVTMCSTTKFTVSIFAVFDVWVYNTLYKLCFFYITLYNVNFVTMLLYAVYRSCALSTSFIRIYDMTQIKKTYIMKRIIQNIYTDFHTVHLLMTIEHNQWLQRTPTVLHAPHNHWSDYITISLQDTLVV